MRSAALVALCWLSACKPTPAKLEVIPNELKFTNAGDTVILITDLSDKEGRPVQHAPCSFVTGDPLIAEVRQDGTVSANGGGKTEIRLHCEGLSATIPVTVSLPTKVVIEAHCDTRCSQMGSDPLTLRLEGIGASARLAARITDDAGEVVPVEPRWEVADPDFKPGTRKLGVDITREGELRSNGQAGRYLLLVTAGAVVGRGSVEVVAPNVDEVKAQQNLWLRPGGEGQIEPKSFRRSFDGLKPVEGVHYNYTSNNLDVVKVDDDGKLAATGLGATDVVVAADTPTNPAPPFTTVQVTVAEKDPYAVPPKPDRPKNNKKH